MLKMLRALKLMGEVLGTVGAVFAAAAIAVETYQALKKKMRSPDAS